MPNAPSVSSGYPAYKPSGQPWLAEVPAHWDVKRTEHLAHSDKIPVTVAEMEPHMVLHYSIPSIQQTGLPIEEPGEEISSGKILVTGGEILISKLNPRKATITSVEADHPFMVASSEFVPLVAYAVDHGFLKWMYQSEDVRRQLSSMVESATKSHQRVNPTDITKLQIPLPPLPEQITIARYLDAKTAQIDELIAAKERLVQLLTEQRTALIHRAVTRGLDPDAKLKDSGVEWLGDVPGGWDVVKFNRQVHIVEGQVDPRESPYIDMLLIAPNHVESKTGQLIYKESAGEQEAISGKYNCAKGAVIYSKIRPALCKVTIAPEDCLCSADMYGLEGEASVINKYIFYLMLSPRLTEWAIMESDRVAMPKINRETLASLYIPCPAQAEQVEIVRSIDSDTAQIDRNLVVLNSQITSLRALRTALISEVVTGKRDVRYHPLAQPAACEQSSSNAPL